MSINLKPKSIRTAYLLWLPPVGLFGTHRFYLGQRWAGVRMLVVTAILLLSLLLFWVFSRFAPFGFLTFGLLILTIPCPGWGVVNLSWWLADSLLMRGMVKNHNTDPIGIAPTFQENRSGSIRKVKSSRKARLLWLPPLGWFGAHRIYAGRYDSGITFFVLLTTWMIIVGIVLSLPPAPGFGNAGWGVFASLFSIGVLPLLTIWWLVDGFKMEDIIEDYNDTKPPMKPPLKKPPPQHEQ